MSELEQKWIPTILFAAVDRWLWNAERLEGAFKRPPPSLLVLQQDNILCMNELRRGSERSCIQTKSGSNVSMPLWLRSIDFWLFFYKLMFFAEVLLLLESSEDVRYSFKM